MDNNLDNLRTHWNVTDYRGDNVSVDYDANEMKFTVFMTRSADMSVQTYEVFTHNEVQRRFNFLNEGKNPCGRWTDRKGNKFCFENGTPIA